MRPTLIVLALCSCDRVFGLHTIADATSDTIGTGPWNAPQLVVELEATDDDTSLTVDLLQIYFNRNNADVFVTARASLTESWGPAEPLAEIASPSTETTPRISPDGLILFFASDRPGVGSQDIWIATRPTVTSAWQEPTIIGELSSVAVDQGATVDSSALHVVLTSTRAGPSTDIYYARRTSVLTPWSTPLPVAAINTPANESSPFLSADALTLYFKSTQSGDHELYVAERASATADFGPAAPMVELNTPNIESDPWLSPDGHHFFFTSDRSGVPAVWHATR